MKRPNNSFCELQNLILILSVMCLHLKLPQFSILKKVKCFKLDLLIAKIANVNPLGSEGKFLRISLKIGLFMCLWIYFLLPQYCKSHHMIFK